MLQLRFLSCVTFGRNRAISTSALVSCSSDAADVESNLKNRWQEISVETSIKYLQSDAYKQTYGDKPVWAEYRRNFKGQIPPKTRKTCIRKNVVSTGNPCPLCRDEYLVMDYKNLDLVKQFVSPYGEEVYDSMKTGVCQRQQKKVLVAVQRARDYGTLTFSVPHRSYIYEIYCDSYK